MLLNISLREDILLNFPNFEYFNCSEPERLNFNLACNLVGDQQEAFIYYWLFKQLKEHGGCGADFGCGQNIHLASIGMDSYFGLNHPTYGGGPYVPHITSLAENAHKIFNPETFSWVIMSHILEHIDNPIITFRNCCKLLKKNGIIILLMPDATYEELMWDKTHKNFFTPSDFERLIINSNKDLIKTEELDTLHNMFSFNYIGRRI